MTILTTSGCYLSGTPTELVERLESLVTAGIGLSPRTDAELILGECQRIARYRDHIGPALADVAAYNLLKGMAEDGYVLLKD